MSLQVWLPLNGNLQNKGLCGDISVTSTGATVSQEGKIGKCYYFNGSSQYLQLSEPLPNLYTGDFSLAIWLKPTDSNRGVIFSEYASTGSSNVAFELYTNRIIRVYWNASPDWRTGIALEQDVWSHVVFTRHENTLKVYINGELKATKDNVTLANRTSSSCIRLGDDYRSGTSVSYAGYMNDARIYDHILSLKEIKEISKGLILHYPLDNNGLGNPNLFVGSAYTSTDIINFTNESNTDWTKPLRFYNGSASLHSFSDGIDTIKLNSTANIGIAFVRSASEVNLDTNTKYTISCQAWCSSISKPFCIGLSYYKTNNTWRWRSGTNGQYFSAIETWQKFTLTFTPDEDTQYICYCFTAATGGNNILKIRNCKLEKGTIATQWSPAPEEVGADDIIYDSSGYQNNGILTDLTYSTDTLKYNASANFDGNTSVISLGNISSLLQKQFTINLWFKKSELGSKGFETLFGGPGGFEMDTRAGSSTTLSLYMASTRGGNVFSSFNLNQWYMVTMINDDTNELYYINGELKKTIAKKSMPSGNYFIGAWSTAIKQNYKGLISDFRIYSTVLNEKDILELYHTSVIVDKNNNFYTYQYNQQGNGNEIEYFHSFRSCYADAIAEMKEDGFHIEGYDWIDHGNGVFIPVNPTNKIYKFDIICSISAGNQFYIGWERYDQNKATGTNSATIYAISPKPTEDLVYQRYQGTINLSANGLNNPCAFIKLRILNKWSGSTTNTEGKAIIHYLSLKEYDSNKTITPIKIEKEGIVTTNSFIENSIGTSIDRSQILHSNSFYEI